jgi:hypothetical protein
VAVRFNPIACRSPWFSELRRVSPSRGIENAITCSFCGTRYGLIVPADTSEDKVRAATLELRQRVHDTCGMHPPVLQIA